MLNLIFFPSTELCTILMQDDVIQGDLKLMFRLHDKNLPIYRVEKTVEMKFQLVSASNHKQCFDQRYS